MKKNIKKRGGEPLSEEIINDAIARASKEGYSDNIDSIYVHYCNEILYWRDDRDSKKNKFLYMAKLKDGYTTRLFCKQGDWFYYRDHNIFKLEDSNVPLIEQRRNEYIEKIRALEQDARDNSLRLFWYDDYKDLGDWYNIISRSECRDEDFYAYDIYYRKADPSKYEVLILTYKNKSNEDVEYLKSMAITMDASELYELSYECSFIAERSYLSARLYCYIRRVCPDWNWFEEQTFRNWPDEYSSSLLLYGLMNDNEIVKAYLKDQIGRYYHSTPEKISDEEKDLIRWALN